VCSAAASPAAAANDAKLRNFAIRAVKAQPLGYLHAVLGGLALSVEWPRHTYPDVGTVYFYYFHLTPYPIRPTTPGWPAAPPTPTRCSTGTPPRAASSGRSRT
jgi:hypothetical protein